MRTDCFGRRRCRRRGHWEGGQRHRICRKYTEDGGNLVYAAGFDQDKVLGNGAILYAIKTTSGAPGTIKVTSNQVTLFTASGSLKGTASATLTVAASGSETVSNGKLNLTKGSGSQKGHSLTATFTGTGSLAKLAFTFNYKGTYK